ncbi:putative nonribosomal peptide synthase [Aspergillus bertholletiae]|uniref:Putative nonribosomal peptide synthase n=1 Tax=Aspergillus bertholletiae TaxID=1226010 RepID=A0A5N7BJ40_9EURO|nr:putative nonribosomal peptide synthase [Aspergillus bertholletiae]
MSELTMLSELQHWGRLIPSSNELRNVQIPTTLLPVQLLGSINGVTTSHDNYDTAQPINLANQADLNSLIEGYARGIIAVTDQQNVAFWVAPQPGVWAIERLVVVAQGLANSPKLEWEALVAQVQDPKERPEAVEFALCFVHGPNAQVELADHIRLALCVDIQSSTAKFIYQTKDGETTTIQDLGRRLHPYLQQSKEDNTEFWTRELEGFLGLCDRLFPTLSCVRITHTTEIAPTVSRALRLETSWEELHKVAMQVPLQSATTLIRASFAYILSEYLESDRVILGEMTTGDDTFAHSDKRMPLPILISPHDKVEDLLRQIDNFLMLSAKLPPVPEELVRDILQCPPLQDPFHAIFLDHVNTPLDDAVRTDFHYSHLETMKPPALLLRVQRSDDGILTCTLSSRTDVMDSAHLELVLRQIEALITAMVHNRREPMKALTQLFPDSLISSHTPVVSEQLEQAPERPPYYWVDHWATLNPSWPAVEVIESISGDVIESQRWSYRELSQASDRLSTWLIRRGWRNSMIGVCLGRSFMAYSLVLAIWKSGNCYVPIAEDLPDARRVLLLSDSGATVLFTVKEVLGSVVPPEGCEMIDINNPQFQNQLDAIEDIAVIDSIPSDNCYLLYTSGSTGLPKGVLVSRGNLSSFTEAQSDYICRDVPETQKLGGLGSYLAHASRAFDVHICEMVLGWRHGLRLVTAPRTMLLDNLHLVLTRCRISHAGFVPSLLEHTGMSAEELPDLRYLGVGGEKISETIIERFVGKPTIVLVNAYGPTEVTIGMTSHTVTPSSTVRNIGSAVGKITLHVLEPESNNYVKRGQAGELCVTGDLVANGYHRRPDANGFTDFYGQRMYRTGDIVRLMANDCVEYLGRRDSQAKVRGQRLELEEVSIAVRRCANRPINVTSIVTPSPITKRPQLVTFISPASDRPGSSATQPTFLKDLYLEWVPQILERCCEQLPVYMVPSVLLPVSFIPIQISGKADNRRLVSLYENIPASDLLHETKPSPMIAHGQTLNEGEPTLTTEEQEVCDIVCTVASADGSTATKSTSIFQLGIDSLTSLNLATQMRKAGYNCSSADILRNHTISQLASLPRHYDSLCLGDESGATQLLDTLDQNVRRIQKPIPNASIAVVRPCLPLQESLVSNSVGNSTALYVNHMIFRLRPSTSLEGLKAAFEDLIHENEIFRTCFHIMDNRVVQVVLKPRAAQVPWESLAISGEEAARDHFTNSQARVAFNIVANIEKQPPLHILAALSTNNDHSGWIMLSIHHSIFDGASLALLLDRLYHHYTGAKHMPTIDHTPLYRYFVTTPEEEAEKYWTSYLSQCRPTIIPTKSLTDTSYSILTERLPLKLSILSGHASKISTTVPLLLEAIWGIALAQHLGQPDVMFGRVLNGRGIQVDSVERMLVPLVTTVPSRLHISSRTASLIDLIQKHTQASLESMPYQHTALRAIQRYIHATGPLFNSMFSYLAVSKASPDEGLLEEIESIMEVDYPLALEIIAETDGDVVILRLRTASNLSMTPDPNRIINTISILVQNLASNGNTVVSRPDLVEQQVQMQPQWDESQWAEEEIWIRDIVSKATGLSQYQISKNASFFALGIDSVISIRLARSLHERGLKASSGDVLKYPSIGALYHHLRSAIRVPSKLQGENIVLDPNPKVELFHGDDAIVDIYRCTPLQTAMIGQSLSSDRNDYVHHHIVSLDDCVDIDRLSKAWQELVGQVDILRTSFHRSKSGHEFLAAVHRYPLMQYLYHAEDEPFSNALERIYQQASYTNEEGFQRPPWKVAILSQASDRLMVLTMHHCLYDGVSLPLLFDSLQAIYQGRQLALGSFASAARVIASIQKTSVPFWTEVISGYQSSGVLLSPDNRLESDPQWAEVKVESPMATLQQQCGTLEVTLQTVALLAFGRSLALLLGQRDIIFGHVVSGRGLDTRSTAPIIGPLLNTVPFRLTLDPILQNTRSVLKHIQRFCVDALHHQHASLGLIQNSWRLDSRNTTPSLFDALFSFNKSEALGNTSIFQPYLPDHVLGSPHYKLNVEFEQRPDFLIIRASCRDSFTRNGELEAWLQTLALGLVDIVSSPDAPVLRFPPELGALPLVACQKDSLNGNATETHASGEHVDTIKDILARVTGTPIDQIQASSSIFTLGVDSILAIDISAKCRNAQLKLSVSDILQGKTVEGIARLAAKSLSVSNTRNTSTAEESLISSEAREKALATLSLAEREVEAVLPCLSGQLFYVTRWLQSGRRLWEFTFAFKSRIRLDTSQIQHAWSQLQHRHSVLRTSFAAISSDEVLQVVSKSPQPSGNILVDSRSSANDLQLAVQHLVHEISVNPSTLFTPPARLHLLQHRDTDILLLTLHHALYDGWSIAILIRDLEALYLRSSLPAPVDFSSFVCQAKRRVDEKHYKEYWESALSMGQSTILGSSVSNSQDFMRLNSCHAAYPSELNQVEKLCNQKGISMPAFILLVVSRSLARIADVTHPTLGLFQSGRSNTFNNIHNLAGPTVNMLPFIVQHALSNPVLACAEAIQRDLGQRTLYDQADLRQLLHSMRTSGYDIQFNVLVNIVWGRIKDGSIQESLDPLLTPVPIEGSSTLIKEPPSVESTPVDMLNCNELPCRRNLLLQVSHSTADDALVWKIDYTPDCISPRAAQDLLGCIKNELDEVLQHL